MSTLRLMGRRFARTLGVGVMSVVAGIGAVIGLVSLFGYEAACNAYAVGVPLVDDERVRVGDYVIRDHSHRDRDPCRGDDLWHYGPRSLGGVDGVLFSDCEISWVGGGRSPAGDIGLPCSER